MYDTLTQVMGDVGCSRSDVATTIKQSTSFASLHSEWKSVAIDLGIPDHQISHLSDEYILGVRVKGLPQLLDELLSLWRAEKGDQAKISHLCKAFDENHLTDIAQCLENRFR